MELLHFDTFYTIQAYTTSNIPLLLSGEDYFYSYKHNNNERLAHYYKQTSIIKFLYPYLSKYIKDQLCENSAAAGNLQLLQWARRNGCPWDESTCAFAAEHGHVGGKGGQLAQLLHHRRHLLVDGRFDLAGVEIRRHRAGRLRRCGS